MKIVAVKERSGGNETVGDMWLETCIFDGATPIETIVAWAGDGGGRLIITVPDQLEPDSSQYIQ